ncbi:uncharacterized protein LACBIDRAFT_298073 [Laccaria bicolor S238N-H82]|uniref:Predicted protein n=1 Tax=Laccaria bicolor (strain S238N-H82 / ATCC MYA-4686) TaxID=486041 RepID=B0DC64_LACBS|nr:uncharacterized protein LACBIDRAFT_298073 [Laccaria bicolor S238N-H82]EDR07838.1 predicted protein [Laccaria bicolor S238N-H82]|eukprot:XP_001881627.1 predicted protein [Laccaria bicolor S238N-H82]
MLDVRTWKFLYLCNVNFSSTLRLFPPISFLLLKGFQSPSAASPPPSTTSFGNPLSTTTAHQ